MVVSDDSEITLRVEGRSKTFLVSLDSRHETIEAGVMLKVIKETFRARLIKLPNNQIFDTLRQKLHWGIDIRNVYPSRNSNLFYGLLQSKNKRFD